ncbi:MAG: hypothetical protein WC340_18795 [Kiritimatiellia bacterium]
MELIERYVAEVGRRLPENLRVDVEKELLSLTMDELEHRVEHAPPYSEAEVVPVLEAMGPPQEVALRYTPTSRYVIGPQLYDKYLLVVGITLGAVALGTAIALSIELAVTPTSVGAFIGQIISALISGAFGAFGVVTLVFAILEKTLPDAEKNALAEHEKWDPRKLPPVPRLKSQVKIGDSVASVCFALLALLIINLLSRDMGAYFVNTSGWNLVSIVDQAAVQEFLPYWNIIWAATIIHHLLLLIKQQWSTSSRVLDIALSVFSVGVLAYMLSGPSLLSGEMVLALAGEASPADLETLKSLLQIMLKVGLVVAAIATFVDVVKKTYRLVADMATARK